MKRKYVQYDFLLPGEEKFRSLQILQVTNFATENFGGFSPGPIRKYIRNKGNGTEGARKFLAGQISCRKNLVGFLKTVQKNLVKIPDDKIYPSNFILGENLAPQVIKTSLKILKTTN